MAREGFVWAWKAFPCIKSRLLCRATAVLFVYVAVIAILAEVEDRASAKKEVVERSIRETYRSTDIDLLDYALMRPDPGDPCPHVQTEVVPAREKLARAPGRMVMSGSEFVKQYFSKPVPRLPHSNIPMVFHQTWWSRKLKDKNKRLSATWLRCMPDWIHVLWDDDEARELFRTNKPELLAYYDTYPYPVQRSDVFRYLVMHRYGGLYADMDYECVGRIDGPDGLDGNHAVYISGAPNPAVDGLIQNTLMASVPGHEFWTHVMATMVRDCGRMWEIDPFTSLSVAMGRCATAVGIRRRLGWTGISVLKTTGPQMISSAYTTARAAVRADIFILPVEHFNGQADRGGKDTGVTGADSQFSCADKAIHRNSAGWTKNSPFPYTGEHTVLGKRMPHRLIALLIVELYVLAAAWFGFKSWFMRQFSQLRDRLKRR